MSLEIIRLHSKRIDELNERIKWCKADGDGSISVEERLKSKLTPIKGGIVLLSTGRKVPNKRIMIVAQNPGISNKSKGTTFENIIPFGIFEKNQYNQFFYDLFKKIPGIYLFTNIVKCITENNTVPTNKVCQICYERHLKNEIKEFNPHFIIYCGKANLNFFEKEVFYTNGKEIFIYHPGYLNRNVKMYLKTLKFLEDNLK